MSNKPPVQLSELDSGNDLTFRACATEVFRWIRSGVELIEETPAIAQSVLSDLEQAWRDSAKKR